jgi:hypothetical protein
MPPVWERVRRLEGQTLNTLTRARPFTVLAVGQESVRLRPEIGKHSERCVPRRQIEHIASLGLPKEKLRQAALAEFPKSQNTSYIAALAFSASR